LTGLIDSTGEFLSTVNAQSADSNVELTIPEGPIGYTLDASANRVPLQQITIVPTNAPTGSSTINVLGQLYDLGPSGAHFEPAITLAFNYDPALYRQKLPR